MLYHWCGTVGPVHAASLELRNDIGYFSSKSRDFLVSHLISRRSDSSLHPRLTCYRSVRKDD